MPRRPRLDVPGLPQHVVQRGNNRGACFFADDDYRRYLDWLRKGAGDHGVAVHAYVLMTNHVHLLATPAKPGALATMMQSLGRRYVRYVNHAYQRTGSLWEGRYRAGAVDSDDYLLRVYRYIELNPVRAGMVGDPGEYRWSSYTINSGAKASDWLKPHVGYLALGRGSTERADAYRALFQDELDPEDAARIRTAVNLGIGVSDPRFHEELAAIAQAKRKGGRTRKDELTQFGEQLELPERDALSDPSLQA
ncbi:MAG: transposase [Betaproteobacteria bacterium]